MIIRMLRQIKIAKLLTIFVEQGIHLQSCDSNDGALGRDGLTFGGDNFNLVWRNYLCVNKILRIRKLLFKYQSARMY